MAAKQDKGYRRSWKNLLINKRYQLRFTLFMVGLSTILMLGLGMWVLHEARIATEVGINDVEGRDVEGRSCAETAPAEDGSHAAPARPAEPAEPAPADGEPGADGESERPRIQVEIGEMQLTPPTGDDDFEMPPAAPSEVAACLDSDEQAAKIAELEAGYDRIKLVLAACGVLMVFGLTFFGIKTTHKVAGPLYKMTLYFDKMHKGTYDQVYSLRRGDQLVEFYEQFKAAHAGLRTMQERDIEVLRGVLEAAESADLGSRSPEIAALLDEMRQTLESKEKSLD